MARVTVEDCIEVVPNRFDLVLYAADRSRQLSSGVQPTIEVYDDKNPVVALREIAREVDPEAIKEHIIGKLQRYSTNEEQEEEFEDFLIGEEDDWAGQMEELQRELRQLEVVDRESLIRSDMHETENNGDKEDQPSDEEENDFDEDDQE